MTALRYALTAYLMAIPPSLALILPYALYRVWKDRAELEVLNREMRRAA